MRAVWRILRVLLGAAPWAMARGAALAVVVLLAGAALLGLSGWFITATGMAGLAGIGIAFDVFRPSAGVRFLALGRTGARYGERLLTHDATLRALAALRVALLRRQAGLGARELARLRSETVLTRIVADVDALDGLVLRLALPVLAAVVVHLTVFAALVWIVGGPVALVVLGGYVPVAALVLWRLARHSAGPSDRAEREGQALRRGMIDMIRDREALILSGTLARAEERLVGIDAAARAAAAEQDMAERDAGFRLSLLVAAVAGAAVLAGGWMLRAAEVDAAVAVIGLFVALALAEAVLPLRRGFAELGRGVGAARRIDLGETMEPVRPELAGDLVLEVAREGIAFRLGPGEAVALTGASGAGKSTLNAAAGLGVLPGVTLNGRAAGEWDEGSLRRRVTLLPQRSALMAGSIGENLRLAGEVSDEALWDALEAVALAGTIRARGGLEARLGEGGSGLSGGEARRLALARALLRAPDLLLLDEPTEGLDAATARAVLDGVRRALPRAALLVALHRGADHSMFGAVHHI